MGLILGLAGKYRLQLAALLLALSAFLFWSHHEYARGVKAQQAKDAHALIVAQARADKASRALAQKSAQVGAEAKQAQVRILTRTKTLIERIPHEVPVAADPGLPAGFLRLYNASLGLPEGPGPSTGADKPDPGLPAADALRTVVPNNAACLLWEDRAERLSALYEAVRAKVND